MVVTTDPEKLPEKQTWYLTSNLPHPNSEQATESKLLGPTDLAEIVRLYGLRMWVEQSYKQVKHVLGWSDYQVRSNIGVRRHWQLVCLAFSFCWWAYGRLPTDEEPAETRTPSAESVGRGKKETLGILAGGVEGGEGVAGAVGNALEILEGVLRDAPAAGAKSTA